MGYGLILNFLKILLRNINSPLKNTFRGLSVLINQVRAKAMRLTRSASYSALAAGLLYKAIYSFQRLITSFSGSSRYEYAFSFIQSGMPYAASAMLPAIAA